MVEKKTKKTAEKLQNAEKTIVVGTRGRVFEGTVIKKFPKRVVIEFEKTIYIRKYERYAKNKTKIHARLPDQMALEIHVGDYIKVRECRPLSKLIHFMVVEKIRGMGETEGKKKKAKEKKQ